MLQHVHLVKIMHFVGKMLQKVDALLGNSGILRDLFRGRSYVAVIFDVRVLLANRMSQPPTPEEVLQSDHREKYDYDQDEPRRQRREDRHHDRTEGQCQEDSEYRARTGLFGLMRPKGV